jgi:hypothetical protein
MMRAVRNPWFVRCTVAALIVIGTAACSTGDGTGSASASSSPSDASSVAGSPVESASATGSGTTAADGIYSVTITERDAADAGVPKGRFSQVVGDYELDLVRGQLAMYFTGVITLDLLRGTYTVRGKELELASDGGPTLLLTWARDHGGLSLTLEDTDQPADRAIDEMIFSTHRWNRTG